MWLLYAVISAIIWGVDYSVGEEILNKKISPITLLAFQTVFGGIFLFIFDYFFINSNLKREVALIWHNTTLLWLLFWAIITFNAANLLIFLSIKEKNAMWTGLIELSYPIFILLSGWLLFQKNRFSWPVASGGILILLGAFITTCFG